MGWVRSPGGVPRRLAGNRGHQQLVGQRNRARAMPQLGEVAVLEDADQPRHQRPLTVVAGQYRCRPLALARQQLEKALKLSPDNAEARKALSDLRG